MAYGPAPDKKKKVLEHSHIHLFTYCPRLLSTTTEVSNCNEDHMVHKPKITTIWHVKKKFASP